MNRINQLIESKLDRLTDEQISQLSSDYLSSGAFQDSFVIKCIDLSPTKLEAVLAMTSFGVSASDSAGYHLTAPTVFRMVGQIVVIHGHWILGQENKCLEVWVKEHFMKHRKPIRDPNHISISMNISDPRAAASVATMIGLHYDISVGDNAVIGNAKAFIDTKSLSDTERRKIFSAFPHQ